MPKPPPTPPRESHGSVWECCGMDPRHGVHASWCSNRCGNSIAPLLVTFAVYAFWIGGMFLVRLAGP